MFGAFIARLIRPLSLSFTNQRTSFGYTNCPPGAVQPFMHIASDFLQSKWYPGNPQAAGAGNMSRPYALFISSTNFIICSQSNLLFYGWPKKYNPSQM